MLDDRVYAFLKEFGESTGLDVADFVEQNINPWLRAMAYVALANLQLIGKVEARWVTDTRDGRRYRLFKVKE